MSRRRVGRALARTAAALGLTMAAFTTTTAPAGAAPQPMGRCTTSSGVVLAVDFSHWGGPVYRSCGTTPTTGYELLNQGGWRTTGTGHDGPAFICRIGYSGHQGGKQYPTPQQDDCVLTPPASAYWSYWHAGPGQRTWEYSQLGAMLYKPEPGSVDLWIFGGTDIEGTKGKPTLTPDQLRAKNTRPTGGSGPVPRDTRTAPPLPRAPTPAPRRRTRPRRTRRPPRRRHRRAPRPPGARRRRRAPPGVARRPPPHRRRPPRPPPAPGSSTRRPRPTRSTTWARTCPPWRPVCSSC